MAVPRSSMQSNRTRNVFGAGLALGVILTLILTSLGGDEGVSRNDIERINERLGAIDQKLQTPAPAAASATSAPGAVTISSINKNFREQIGKSVELTGKVSNAHQGVGFTLVDTDGSFLWVHTKDKIPSGNATVKGTVTELKDQLAQWKNEPGWPAEDATLTTKLRDEKVFLEALSVT